MSAPESEVDGQGQWTGTCPKCGTNHEGRLPGSFGAEVRCLRVQAEQAGAPHLVDQIDALQRHAAERRDEVLAGEGLIPSSADDEPFDPGPCPHCGERNYEVNWVDVGYDGREKIPGTVTCLNPQCPGRVPSKWIAASESVAEFIERAEALGAASGMSAEQAQRVIERNLEAVRESEESE